MNFDRFHLARRGDKICVAENGPKKKNSLSFPIEDENTSNIQNWGVDQKTTQAASRFL